ncbi:MAG: hypothetical protein AAF519_00215 [Bacteroidota bacterium]
MKCLKTSLRKNVLKLVFSGFLEARNLSETQVEILKQLKKSPAKVIVEMKKYEKVDFAFIQLLLALQKNLKAMDVEFDFKLNFSEEDADLLSRLHIKNILETKS